LKEDKIPVDKRTPLTPKQCLYVNEKFSELTIYVQESSHRCFTDSEYLDLNIKVVKNLDCCDIIIGIKEIKINNIIQAMSYIFFSHTIKKQEYNKELLKSLLSSNNTLYDYEVMKNNGKRLIGFGKYAGIVGAYNSFRAYGLKTKKFKIDKASNFNSKEEIFTILNNIQLSNEKILITGVGNVSKGIIEVLQNMSMLKVDSNEIMTKTYNEPVYSQIDCLDYYKRIDNSNKDIYDFYNNPSSYVSTMKKYLSFVDILITGHYHSELSPPIITKSDLNLKDLKLKVIGDISCDINGPVSSTIRASKIESPIYGYNMKTEKEDDFMKKNVLAVMAVDNLPCELPRDSSRYFGNKIIEHVLPLFYHDKSLLLEKATICRDGDLTNNFEYLRDFVNND
jgi:hypothetical protein